MAKIGVTHRPLSAPERAERDAKIRLLRAQGVPLAALCQRFGLGTTAIMRITKGVAWAQDRPPVERSDAATPSGS